MKRILMTLFIAFSLNATELPSYQCRNIYEASFIASDGSVKPKIKKASGESKLNVMIDEDQKRKIYLNVNGTKILVTDIVNGYVYAIEFTAGGMHTWVLFKNKKDKKTYLTLSKTYDLFGKPLTVYALYNCKQVNNKL